MDTLNVTQAARYLGVTEKTLRKWIKHGKLPSARKGEVDNMWIIPISELASLAKPGKEPATENGPLWSAIQELRARVEQLEQAQASGVPTRKRVAAPPAKQIADRKSEALQNTIPDGWVALDAVIKQHTLPGDEQEQASIRLSKKAVREITTTKRIASQHGVWTYEGHAVHYILSDLGEFYEVMHSHHDFHPCPQCPHGDTLQTQLFS